MVSGLLEELVEEGNSLEIFFFSAPTLLPENVKGFFSNMYMIDDMSLQYLKNKSSVHTYCIVKLVLFRV